ncbi:MAG: hypothetical protein JRI54_11150, partial [Deltaproteobacteria bacterium]|nr:hypothetical protein [Deltaproteobacteria bacterium]
MKSLWKSKSVFVLFIALILFCLAICVPHSVQAAKQGGIVEIAFGMNPNRMDPPNSYGGSDMMIGCHIFERLIYFHYDENTKKTTPKPSLAKRWELSGDGKVWTFYLRKGIKFHDGTLFNAEAVKFNIERTASDKPRTRYGADLRAAIDRVEVVDDSTIKIYCKSVNPTLIHHIAQPCLGIMSPASVEKYGTKIGRHPTGTGPFKFVKWVPGERVELEVNKEYWKGRANLDGVVFLFVPDDNARINMVQTGEIDIAYNVPVQDHARLRKNKNLDIITWPTATILRFYMNCQ